MADHDLSVKEFHLLASILNFLKNSSFNLNGLRLLFCTSEKLSYENYASGYIFTFSTLYVKEFHLLASILNFLKNSSFNLNGLKLLFCTSKKLSYENYASGYTFTFSTLMLVERPSNLILNSD